MSTVLRFVGAVLAGFVVSFILVILVEVFSMVVHPPPADFSGTQEEMCAHVAAYPHWVLAVVVPMWGSIAFLGTWIAGRVGNRGSAIFLALLLLGGVIFNVAMLPYPLWFKLIQPAAVLAAEVLAYRCSFRPKPAAMTAKPDTALEE